MTWLCVAGYVLGGLLTTRHVNILTERRWRQVLQGRERCGLCSRNRNTLYWTYVCSNHETPTAPFWRRLWLPWVFIGWPIPVAVNLLHNLALGWAFVVIKAWTGVRKTASVVATSPPLHAIGKVNHWFWEDPKDRKTKEKRARISV